MIQHVIRYEILRWECPVLIANFYLHWIENPFT